MTICVAEPVPHAEPRRSAFGTVSALLASLSARKAKLDLEVMPDRVKRDLGFLDGREPRYEDEQRW